MIQNIITNKLNVQYNYKKINRDFDFFLVELNENKSTFSSQLLDSPLLDNSVCSIKYEDQHSFWIMMQKKFNNRQKLLTLLKRDEAGKYVTLQEKESSQIKEHILLQLFFNSLGWSKQYPLSFNNITGHLYCFKPQWLKHKQIKNKNEIIQIPSIEIKISESLHLHLNVTTFTNTLLKNKMIFNKRQFNEYPQYVMSTNNSLKRKTDEKKSSFIIHQIGNKKNNIDFLDLQNINAFNDSKIGLLNNIMDIFETKYNNYATICFNEIETCKCIDHKQNETHETNYITKNIFINKKIRIIDLIQNNQSEAMLLDIQNFLKEKYNIKAKSTKNLIKDAFNIVIIHNKDFYKGKLDPYQHNKSYAIQHITLEDSKINIKVILDTIIHELIIKDDLINNQISIFDWKKLNYKSDMIFGIKNVNNDLIDYFFMTIHTDGSFEIKKEELNFFTMSKYNKYVTIFNSDEDIIGIVENENNEINIIKNTDEFTLPNYKNIYNELLNKNNKLRNKEKRELLFNSCLDIKSFNDNNVFKYFVGTIGNGMRPIINDACLIRSIHPYNDSSLFFESLLPLMNITFVRNNQLTVLPFPFKYLREYIKTYYN